MKECEQDLKDLNRAHKKLADVAAKDIREAVPSKSGKWKGAIKGSGTRTMAKVVWGRASVPYAPWQEFGGTVKWRSRRGMGPRGPFAWGYRTRAVMFIKRPRVPSGRYVYPTAHANEQKYLEVFTDLLAETLRRNGFR